MPSCGPRQGFEAVAQGSTLHTWDGTVLDILSSVYMLIGSAEVFRQDVEWRYHSVRYNDPRSSCRY